MHTTLFLVRHGATEWAESKRLLGRRDVSLSNEGRRQAQETGARLAKLEIAEVISSPLLRALATAEEIAAPHHIDVARDPRLLDLHAGRWEGMSYDEIVASPEYQTFIRDPRSSSIPGGEQLHAVRDRAVTSIEQALSDNALGANIVVVSHAGVVRVLLAHYLGMSLANYHRFRVAPGSISVLRFDTARELPRVLAVNHGGALDELVG